MLHTINGFAIPELQTVIQTFKKQLHFSGGGAALCIYHHGEPIVDVWAGTRNPQGNPWLKETTTVSFSTTKGVLSTLLHIIMEQAQLDYETQVSHIWPSFKQHNKGHITIRQILCHESALFNLQDNIETVHDIYDWDHMVWTLAQAKPSMRHLGEPSYHAITYGWLVGELIHRLTGQLPGVFLDTEMRSIMGRNNFIGVPQRALDEVSHLLEHIEQTGASLGMRQRLQRQFGRQFKWLMLKSPSTMSALQPTEAEHVDFNSPAFLTASIPSMNGVFTARGLAKLYNVFATPDDEKHKNLLSPRRKADIQTIQSLSSDRIVHVPMHWRLGYHRILNFKKKAPFGFGHYGYGGSGAWCDPSRHLSVGFTVNTLWGSPIGDFRMAQLAGDILSAVDKLNVSQNSPEHSLNS